MWFLNDVLFSNPFLCHYPAMSTLLRFLALAGKRRAVLAPLVTIACLATAVSGANAASPARNVKFDVPSLKGNVDPSRVQFNDATKSLTAWVRLPAGYDDEPNRRWPVVYLLHGWEDSSDAWLDPKKGQLASILPDFPAIVVLPEGAKAWFINWASPKGNPGQKWGDYLLEEVVPFMESNLRIMPGRANHAIGGLSMGGFGGLAAVSTLPTYFGHGLSFSGLLDNQDFNFSQIINIAQFGNAGYRSVFGPSTGAYAESVNPLKNAKEFGQSRLTVTYGTPNASIALIGTVRQRGEASLEVGAQGQALQFLRAVRGTGAVVDTHNRQNGSHNWYAWRNDLIETARRGMFGRTPVSNTSEATKWTYGTMADHGNAWGLGFKLPALPTQKVVLTRNGSTLTGSGRGTITIAGGAADADASGNGTRADCTFTLTLPFTQQLPAGC